MSTQPPTLTEFSRYLLTLAALFVALMAVIVAGGVVKHTQVMEVRKQCYASNERIAQTFKGSKEDAFMRLELNDCH